MHKHTRGRKIPQLPYIFGQGLSTRSQQAGSWCSHIGTSLCLVGKLVGFKVIVLSTIVRKGNNFCVLLFAFMAEEAFPKGGLLLKERICSNSFPKELTTIQQGGKIGNNGIAFPPKMHLHLIRIFIVIAHGVVVLSATAIVAIV